MSSNGRRSLLGMAAVMGLGLLALGAKPAAADPPRHAPAWGWRSKQSSYNNDYRYRNGNYDRGRGSRYDRNYRNGRSTRNDADGDRVPNWRDRDVDGDGIPNSRDRDIDGDRIPNYRDNWDYTRGSGYPNGSQWNRRRNDRDIDNDGRRNWRDRDRDGDGRRNSRDRYDRNPRRR